MVVAVGALLYECWRQLDDEAVIWGKRSTGALVELVSVEVMAGMMLSRFGELMFVCR